MIEGKWFAQGSDIAVPLAIRKAVFGTERDALDNEAQQVVVYREGKPVGSARLWWQDGAFRMGLIGVLEEERGHGCGDLLVRLLLFKSLTHNAQRIALTCAKELAPFFAKYGFAAETDGDVLQMSIDGPSVCLGCGGCH